MSTQLKRKLARRRAQKKIFSEAIEELKDYMSCQETEDCQQYESTDCCNCDYLGYTHNIELCKPLKTADEQYFNYDEDCCEETDYCNCDYLGYTHNIEHCKQSRDYDEQRLKELYQRHEEAYSEYEKSYLDYQKHYRHYAGLAKHNLMVKLGPAPMFELEQSCE